MLIFLHCQREQVKEESRDYPGLFNQLYYCYKWRKAKIQTETAPFKHTQDLTVVRQNNHYYQANTVRLIRVHIISHCSTQIRVKKTVYLHDSRWQR